MKKTYKINLPKGMTIKPGSIDYCYDNDRLDISVELEKERYEPRIGDIVCFTLCPYYLHSDRYVAIFGRLKGDILMPYCIGLSFDGKVEHFYKKMHMPDTKDMIRSIRPATEEEKKLLIDKLAEAGKKWNPDTKQIEDVRWRAEKGEVYFHLVENKEVVKQTDMRLACDDRRYENGNYFKTREAAQKAADQIREIFRNSKAE